MIEGAITFQSVPCEEIMTKISRVTYTLEMETVLSTQVLNEIRENGYSRIPICEGGNINKIVAFLLTKSLIGLDTSQQKTLRQLYLEKRVQVKIPLYLHRESNLGKMIKSF
jgi:CBS domain containing-hemolysin-like protein